MAISFSTSFKNALLDTLIGKTSSNAQAMTSPYVRISTSGGVALTGASGTAVGSWGSPTAGTSQLTATSLTPSASGTAANLEWWQGTTYQVATGTVSTTGGGGGLIVGTTSFVASTPVSILAVLAVPLDNGGTLKVNQALANMIAMSMIASNQAAQMASAGTFVIYDGTQPATADTAITSQNALGTYTFTTADYSSASNGASVLTGAKTITGSATGTATWARWTKGAFVIDGSVGTTGADFIVSTTSIVNGVNFSLTAATLTFP